MKWPQFELWRLLAAIGLLGASLVCFAAFFGEHLELVVLGPVFLLAAIGTLFKKGLVFALGAPLIVLFIVMLYAIVQSWIRALS